MAFDEAITSVFTSIQRPRSLARRDADRARLIALTQYVGLPVRRILDAGCGIGLRARRSRVPAARRLHGPRDDEYLCARYGAPGRDPGLARRERLIWWSL